MEKVKSQGKLRYVRAPTKLVAGQGGHWAESRKQDALKAFLSMGSAMKVSRELNIPHRTIELWRKQDWWKDGIKEARETNQDQLDIKLSDAIDKALDGINDRLVNGETVIDPRTGKERKVPTKLRDLTAAFNSVMDKRQILRKQPTRIVEQVTTAAHLDNLAKQFAAFVSGRQITEKQEELIENVIEGETVQQNEDGEWEIIDGKV